MDINGTKRKDDRLVYQRRKPIGFVEIIPTEGDPLALTVDGNRYAHADPFFFIVATYQGSHSGAPDGV